MKISILHQYPDFRRTIFYHLLAQESKTPLEEVAPDKAAVIIYGPFARRPKIVGRFVKRKAVEGPRVFKNRTFQPLNVFHTIENVRHEDKYDYSIGYDFPIKEQDFRFPYWMETIDWSHEGVSRPAPLRVSRYFTIPELQKPLGRFLEGRNGRCAAFFGHVREPRRTLINAVAKNLELDAFGPAFDRKIKNSQLSGVFKDQILKDYSFNLCPENSLFPGYYTEKILEGFASGCLPLTWADPNIRHDFNPDAFLNLLDFASSGYEGWINTLNAPSELKKFESAKLLTSVPTIEPLRNYVKSVINDVR